MRPISRRELLKQTGIALTGAFVAGSGTEQVRANALGSSLGIQLYTVDEDLKKDVGGTLTAIRAIGYKEVETAGFAGMTAKNFRKALDGAGLACHSAHFFDFGKSDPEPFFKDAHSLGAHYTVSSMVSSAAGKSSAEELTLEDYKKVAEFANQMGRRAKQAGLQFAYHNHDLEFKDQGGGRIGYDILLKETDPELVVFELDCGWIAAAGHSPITYFKRYPKRYRMIHVKDFLLRSNSANSQDGPQGVVLGKGSIDYRAIFAAAKATVIEHYYVEQEPPFVGTTALQAAKMDTSTSDRFTLSCAYLLCFVTAATVENHKFEATLCGGNGEFMGKLSRRDVLIKGPAAAAAAVYAGRLAAEPSEEKSAKREIGASHDAGEVSGKRLTTEQLFSGSVRDTYEGDHLNLIAFPMGGIGTGSISLSGTGQLVDWEIFNNPNRGYQPFYSFLSVFAQEEGGKPAFRVLEGQLRGSLEGPIYVTKDMWQDANGCAPQQTQAAGLPRMRKCKFVGRFPFAHVELGDPSLPVTAKVEGWSPFIPGNANDSSIPVAALNVTLNNPGKKLVHAAVSMSMQNCAGDLNEAILEEGISALHMRVERGENAMFIASPRRPDSWQLNWFGRMTGPLFFMSLQHFVDTFGSTGKLDNAAANPGTPLKPKDTLGKVGSLAFEMTLKPGDSMTVPILIGWYFPVFDTADSSEMNPGANPWRNWYGTQWASGLEVARYAVANLKRLEAESRLFQDRFFSSTLPGVVLEAASTQLAILKSTTIIRYPDGTIYGWEGCAPDRRLGYGTCNHVWNYQQAIPYLFPNLQRSILNNFYENAFRDSDGAIQYRIPVGPGAKAERMPAIYPSTFALPGSDELSSKRENFLCAADGQLGMIAQVYRDWHISGNTEWLKSIWPRVKKSLEFAWTGWDVNRDGQLEGPHHNTLDLYFTTPETMCGSEYQVALLAAEQMARAIGDMNAAAEYRRIFESGKTLTDKELFNGEYYCQKTPAPGPNQLGTGCISEQLTGQLYARMLELEDVYNHDHIQTALKNLYRYNYRSSMDDVINTNRPYSLNDEAGLLTATWPRGGRPELPPMERYETLIGCEYQVAFNLIYAGYVEEGLILIASIRDRFEGKKRNPFCEFEWGNHYARSLISYTGMIALSRFRYSAVDQSLQLSPQLHPTNFRQFFSVESGWGMVSQKINNGEQVVTVSVDKGNLSVLRFLLKVARPVTEIRAVCGGNTLSGKSVKDNNGRPEAHALSHITLPNVLTAQPGKPIRLEMRLG